MKFIGRRRTVEIYFILYLAALIFLLPDRKKAPETSDTGKDNSSFQIPYSLQPDKTILTCKLTMDTSGVKIVDIDSVNTVYFSGDVEHMDYEFTVVDQSARGYLALNSDKPFTRNFRLVEEPEKKAVKFYWKPPKNIKTNKTYLVKVKARVRQDNGFDSENQGKASPEYTTRFSLNVVFVDDRGLEIGPAIADKDTSANGFSGGLVRYPVINTDVPYGRLTLNNPEGNIKNIASQRWTKLIEGTNINFRKQLYGKPVITFRNYPQENGGSARIAGVSENGILLEGITPSSGYTDIQLEVTRVKDADGRRVNASVSFRVEPTMLSQPAFEKNMYPHLTYLIKPNLPIIGKEVEARLMDGSIMLARNSGDIYYTPEFSQVGKTLILERFIDSTLIDSYKISVNDFPYPEIKDIKYAGNDKVTVKTYSYGYYENRNKIDKNLVSDLVITGNGKLKQELYGNRNEKNDLTVQYFDIVPKDPESKFSFELKVTDNRGRSSRPRSYN